MRILQRFRCLIIAVLLLPVIGFAQDTYKAAAVKALPSSGDIPAAISAALESQGASFQDGQGATLAELWLGKSIAAAASPASESDIVYGAITPGDFMGVLHVAKAMTDFRGQPVQPGYYTLRYELVPQDGNHMGVSENRDFVLLIPVALDPEPSKALAFGDVVKLSRKATNTGHPAVLTMTQSKGDAPAAFQDDEQHWALQGVGQLDGAGGSKPIPIAVILVGKSDAANM
jgi:hypothetical protein